MRRNFHGRKQSANISGVREKPMGTHPLHDADVFLIHEDREENGYPPRSHDCQPEETEFAQSFEEAQQDLESREKKICQAQANNAHVEECARACLEHTAD